MANWPQTFKNSPLNPAFYTERERLREEALPWDFIDHGLDRDFLWSEYQRALAAEQLLCARLIRKIAACAGCVSPPMVKRCFSRP
jgi:hypothetical protein